MELILIILIVLFIAYALNLFNIRGELPKSRNKKSRKKNLKYFWRRKNFTVIKNPKRKLHFKKKIYNTEVQDLYHTHVETMWNEIK